MAPTPRLFGCHQPPFSLSLLLSVLHLSTPVIKKSPARFQLTLQLSSFDNYLSLLMPIDWMFLPLPLSLSLSLSLSALCFILEVLKLHSFLYAFHFHTREPIGRIESVAPTLILSNITCEWVGTSQRLQWLVFPSLFHRPPSPMH